MNKTVSSIVTVAVILLLAVVALKVLGALLGFAFKVLLVLGFIFIAGAVVMAIQKRMGRSV